VPGGGLTVRLAQAVGVRRARQISLTGEYVDAERARQDGLVSEVLPQDQLMPRAAELAAAIASRSAWIVEAIRAAYDRTLNLPADEALDASRAVGILAQHVREMANRLVDRGSTHLEGRS
jgi:enoyl-CoA hydratase